MTVKNTGNDDGRFHFGDEEKEDEQSKGNGLSERWNQPPRDLQAQGELADRARHVGHDI